MERIGRYRLTERLGAGSFATVYKGHDDELDVAVAVKLLADNWSDNEDVRNRFLAEARLMRKIHDERIVRVYDIGTTGDNRPYFVMDFANGGSLEDLRKRPTDPGRALRLCAEGARALEVLHRNSVIHRDVTPGNLLLNVTSDQKTHVLIADLGVAKSMIGEQGATMTAGTPAYMAFEQATGVGTLDQRADIYSMAAVAYALLTGRPPFPVKTLADLLARNPHIAPAPIADRLGAPRQLDELFAAALSPDPNRRPASAADLAEGFDAFAELLPGGQTYVPRPLPPLEQRPTSWGSANAPGTGSMIGTGYGVPMAPMPGSFAANMYGGQGQATGSMLGQPETPTQVMNSYLGVQQEAQAPARRSPVYFAWLGVAALAVFTVALVITVLVAG